jgi:FkbM family methyltransferase
MPSQYGQDIFALDVLQGMRGGFFLDSGAADGVSSSNTLLLESAYEWTGICVEPNRELFAKLSRNRRCQCLNCCLYTRNGSVDFLESARMLGGILEEYHPSHLQYARQLFRLPGDMKEKPVTVQKTARTVRSVLRECGAPRIIDYWSLDTEGSELAILKSFPFHEYKFRVLTVEHNRLPSREHIRALLESQGYRLAQSLEIDDCYVRDELVPRKSFRSNVWTRVGRGKML